MSSTDSSSTDSSSSSSTSSTSGSRTPNRRRRRSRSPESSGANSSDQQGKQPRKIRKLEKKISKLEEKVEAPLEKKFKYNSNRDQYTLNARVLSDLRAAKKHVKSKRARRRIKSAMKRLETRNKHVRIADTAKSGWKAVELFETSEISKNPKEERLIRKCDKRALEMIQEERERQRKYGSSRGESSSSSRFRNAPRTERSHEDRCYRCGRRDHWGWECPYYAEQRDQIKKEDRH